MKHFTVFLACALTVSLPILCAAKGNPGCEFLPVVISPRAPKRNPGRATGAISTSYVCSQAVTIPDNFDVSLLPSTATSLQIGDCQNGTVSKLNANSPPFPAMPELSELVMCNFQFDDAAAERINALLANVKGNVGIFELRSGKLEALKSGLLAGFAKLWRFQANNVGLKSVDADALSKLGAGTDSVFKELRLASNALTAFDLAILEPVSKSLQVLELHENSIGRFGPFDVSKQLSFPKINHVNVKSNRLGSLTEETLKAFSASSELSIIAYSNGFCSMDAYCRCCNLAPMFRTLKAHPAISVTLSCGDQSSQSPCPDAAAPPAKCQQSCTKQFFLSEDLKDIKAFDKCLPQVPLACEALGISEHNFPRPPPPPPKP